MKSLQEFVVALEKEGELVRVSEFVSIDCEMAEVNDRMIKSGGKAILFENNETKFPVLLNMYGSENRIAKALRVNKLEDLTKRIDNLFGEAMSPKKTLMDKLKLLPILKDASQWLPRNIGGKGKCQEIITIGENVNLYNLPIIKSAPHDPAGFVTMPMVNTIDPETGSRNVGMYRMQIFSKNSTGLHWHKHKTGERHYQKYKSLGEMMPVAVTLGGDAAYTYSATAPLPEGIDEYILSGFLRNKPVKLVKCITNDLRVPEDCDFVIEGYVDPSEPKVIEGPFGDHTGFYSLADYYPTFHVTAITHRKDAIYPATVVGIPPQEDSYIGMATEKIFVSPIRAVMQPEVNDMFMPFEGVAHNIAIFDINKQYEGQGLKVANAMWGAGQMMFNKFMIITSNLNGKLNTYSNYKELIKNINIYDSVITTKGPLDVLDHNAPVCGLGGKMAFDLTERKNDEQPFNKHKISLPGSWVFDEDIVEINDSLAKDGWSILVLFATRQNKDFRKCVDKFLSNNKFEGINMIFIFDNEQQTSDISTLVWIGGNNIDPLRDCEVGEDRIIFDARSKFGGVNGFKREWPNVVTQSEDVIKSIDSKWNKLKLGEFIESPSLKYMHLKFSESAEVK